MDQDKERLVQFEEESNSWGAIKYYRQPIAPKLIQLGIKYSGGLIKEEKQAKYFFVVFASILFAISIYIFFNSDEKAKGSPKMIKQLNELFTGKR